ncbi:MAG: hypothetical protein LBP76_04015 [Treponema sp.]|jgi:hypothetical protein|nr:hypothetical protein [Treponema sp.]
MILIRVKHYYDGIGSNAGDVWSQVNEEEWAETDCRAYVEEEEAERYVLDHNEAERPSYYMVDSLPDWTDGGWYDYDKCESRNKDGAACDQGCDYCPYEGSCYQLQRDQQVDWIRDNGVEI